jgi:lysophospholipase L1-like esterase
VTVVPPSSHLDVGFVAKQDGLQATLLTIGDSLATAGITSQGVMTGNVIGPTSFAAWAILLSNGRLVFKGVSGTTGFTSAQLLATHVPIALAVAPQLCLVQIGVNDAQNAVPIATTIANLTAIYTQLQAAGIRPVLTTVTPISAASSTIRTAITRINAWILRYAQASGLPLVDFHGAVSDTTNGDWTAGLNADTLHQNAAGAKVMGQAIATALAPSTSIVKPVLVDYNNDPGYALGSNQLFLTDSNADGLPDGWGVPTASPTTTNPSNGSILGKYTVITRTAADSFTNYGSNFAIASGDKIYVACRLASTVEASSGGVNLTWYNGDSSQKLCAMQAFSKDIPDGSVWAVEITVPAGLSNYVAFPQVAAITAAGAQIRCGQLSALNLTTAGLA